MRKFTDLVVKVMTAAAFVALVLLSINSPFSEELPAYGTAECVKAQESVISLFVPVCRID